MRVPSDHALSPAQERRWDAVDGLAEALLENELVGNNTGAMIMYGVPDEPIFNRWLGEFCSLLPSYVHLAWEQCGNDRKVGFMRGSNKCMIALRTAADSWDTALSQFCLESADDFEMTPRQAVDLLWKTFGDKLKY